MAFRKVGYHPLKAACDSSKSHFNSWSGESASSDLVGFDIFTTASAGTIFLPEIWLSVTDIEACLLRAG